jgi:hypothetical protein
MMSGSITAGGASGAPSRPGLLVPGALVALIAGGYGFYLYRARRRAPRTDRPAARTTSGASVSRAPASTKGSGRSTAGAEAARTAVKPRAGLFGFEPVEILIGLSVVIIATIIGLASGGFFR